MFPLTAYSVDDLDAARRRVDKGRQRVAEQRERVANLKASGGDAGPAEQLLSVLVETLVQMKLHRGAIALALKGATGKAD